MLLLAGRAIQGVGGGGVLVLAEIVVTDLVPLRFRGNFFSMCECSVGEKNHLGHVLISSISWIYVGHRQRQWSRHWWCLLARGKLAMDILGK
jgi:MFS family permease